MIQLSLQHGFFSSVEENRIGNSENFLPTSQLATGHVVYVSRIALKLGKTSVGFLSERLTSSCAMTNPKSSPNDETHHSVCRPRPFVGAHYTSYIVLVSSVICVESTKKSVFFPTCPYDPLLCLEWIMKDSRSLCTPAFHTYPSVLGRYCFWNGQKFFIFFLI